jgi:hypothetical protein
MISSKSSNIFLGLCPTGHMGAGGEIGQDGKKAVGNMYMTLWQRRCVALN